ncbi:hypothetical protein B0H10DRAFT_1952857 [Mycena sp. CBHHK59/15]|nr:hypothetical protein B0H10DRAFT_1952857 [Mycena sp. CBHHK59/15]
MELQRKSEELGEVLINRCLQHPKGTGHDTHSRLTSTVSFSSHLPLSLSDKECKTLGQVSPAESKIADMQLQMHDGGMNKVLACAGKCLSMPVMVPYRAGEPYVQILFAQPAPLDLVQVFAHSVGLTDIDKQMNVRDLLWLMRVLVWDLEA